MKSYYNFSDIPFICAHCGNVFGDMNQVEKSIHFNDGRNIFCSNSCYSDFNRLSFKSVVRERKPKPKQERGSEQKKPKKSYKEIYGYREIEKIVTGNCCEILEDHHKKLADDPERLSTDFIKNLSKCGCDE